MIAACHLALDEFFMLAAFLSTIKLIPYIRSAERRQVEESNDREVSAQGFKIYKSIPQLWLYRLLRLAPLFYAIFLFGYLVMPYFGSGPLWYLF